jgi:DNA primase
LPQQLPTPRTSTENAPGEVGGDVAQGPDLSHEWVVAASIPVEPQAAKLATMRRFHIIKEPIKVKADDVYCFAAETEFMTRSGARTLGECAGTTQQVLTQQFGEPDTMHGRSRRDGQWVEAEVMSFGEQSLLTVTLTRDGRKKVIRATPNHRWFAARNDSGTAVPQVRTTAELKPGMVLASLAPRDNIRQSTPSTFGIAHGITYGDGARRSLRGSTVGTGAYVDLWGEKDAQLLRYFNDSAYEPIKTPNGSGVEGMRVKNLPGYFKDRPSLDESIPYLYGWLAGYFAADGDVTKAGSPSLNSARREDLEFVRAVADRLGIVTGEIREYQRVGIGQTVATPVYRLAFMRSRLRPQFFLIAEHRERFAAAGEARYERLSWRVESIEDLGEREEVFCAVVPGTESFALADYIWTHNCHNCRRTMADEVDTECSARKKDNGKRDNEHLIGGDQRFRAKRKEKVVPANATLVPGPKIQRRGVKAVVLGE